MVPQDCVFKLQLNSHISIIEVCHEINSKAILELLHIHVEQLSITGKNVCSYWLTT